MSSQSKSVRQILRQDKARDGAPVSPVVRIGDLIFTGGQVALDAKGVVTGDVEAQAHALFERLSGILEQAGGSLQDVLALVSFHTDVRDMETVFNVGRQYFPGEYPAWTSVGYLGCQHDGARLMIRAIAHLGKEPKQCFMPDSQAWLKKYPVSAAVKKGNLVFISGQTAADRDGNFVHPLDHVEQARICYTHMLEALTQAGGKVTDLLDFTSFHLDIRGGPATLEQVYMPEMMGKIHANLSAVTSHVGAAGLLKRDCLAVYTSIGDLSPGGRVGSTPDSIWWKEIYPIAGAAKKRQGKFVCVAGQVASDDKGQAMFLGDSPGQVRFVFSAMKETLEGFGLTMGHVAEITAFQKDVRHWEMVMDVAKDFFDMGTPPAFSFPSMTGLWFEGFRHEISALAIAD
jgi:enamine deaminase RidA (YjgF/YER057c/UK114 family)